MFQSGSRTDDLLYESAVLASQLEEGISFEDTLKSLRKGLGSRSESSTELNIETNEKTIALALFDLSGERKNQISLKKEDLLMVVPSSKKWLYAEKDDKMGFVPFNYVSIFEDVLCEKLQRKIIMWRKKTPYHFQKGTKFKFSKKKWAGVLEKLGTNMDIFP